MENDKAVQIKVNFRSQEFKRRVKEFAEITKEWGGCDKCQQEVRPENNAVIFDYILTGGGDWTLNFAVNRHLEPMTAENGIVICEGSPSRFQKINGLPDTRSQYRGNGTQDELSMAVWNWMQEELGHKPVENEPILRS